MEPIDDDEDMLPAVTTQLLRNSNDADSESSSSGEDDNASASGTDSDSDDDSTDNENDNSEAESSAAPAVNSAASRLQQAALSVAARISSMPFMPALPRKSPAVVSAANGSSDGAIQKQSLPKEAVIAVAKASFADHVAVGSSNNAASATSAARNSNGKSGRGHLAAGGDGGRGVTHLYSDNSSAGPNMVRYASDAGIGAGIKPFVASELPSSSASSSSSAVPKLTGQAAAAMAKAITIDASSTAPAPLLQPASKRVKREDMPTAGKKWFDMAAPELTQELKRDLLILKNRAYLDPKRHYKGISEVGKKGQLPKYFEMGTVVEAAHERLSSKARLTNKQRKPTLVAALLADADFDKYAKRTVEAVHKKSKAGGAGSYLARKAAGKARAGAASASWYSKKGKKGGGKGRR